MIVLGAAMPIVAVCLVYILVVRAIRRRDASIAHLGAAGANLHAVNEGLERQVTERTEELRRQAHLMQSIFDTMADGMIICDRDGQLIHRNAAATLILGVDLAQSHFSELTKQFDVLPSVGAPPTPAEQWPLAQAMRGETVDKVRFVVRGPTPPHEKWLEASARPVTDEYGQVHGGMIVFRDVTLRQQAEGELVRARGLAFHAALLRSEFLDNVSHEILTPLNGIVGMTRLLQETGLSAEQREYTDAVRSSGELLRGIVEDVLDFSNLSDGQFVLEESEFDPHDAMERVAAQFTRQAHKRGIRLTLELDQRLPHLVAGDSHRLEQI
jgi:signal transduction histidine kinase